MNRTHLPPRFEDAIIETDIDRLYQLKEAAALIPMSYVALRMHLSRHKSLYQTRYGYYGPGKRRYRLLTGYEIEATRDQLLNRTLV